MPPDMTVHQPSSRIISDKSNHQVSRARKHSHISSHWIHKIECCRVGESTCSLSQDVEIVTVKMNWMRLCVGGSDHEVHPLVCIVNLNNMVLGGEVGAVDDLLESWVSPVDEECGAAHIPLW